MPPKVIKGSGFKGNGELCLAHWKTLEVCSPADTPRRLQENWGGSIVGFFVARLSTDNKNVDNISFNLGGTLFENEDLKLNCSKFWSVPDNLTMAIPTLNSGIFSFPNGGMTSELVDSSKFQVNWFRDGVALSPEEKAETGITGFCLRFHAIPEQSLPSGTWASLTMVLFPLPKSSLLETHSLSPRANFPGLRFFSSGVFQIGFNSAKRFPDLEWGSPLVPGVILGGHWDDFPFCPAAAELRTKLAITLRNVCPADIKKTPADLKKAWDDIKANGEAALRNTAASLKHIWPLPPTPPPTRPQENMQRSEQTERETGGDESSDEDMQSSVSSASMTSAALRAVIQEEMRTVLEDSPPERRFAMPIYMYKHINILEELPEDAIYIRYVSDQEMKPKHI